MQNIPDFIFKYKGINTKEDLVRLIDIINNQRIYMPRYYELNDPLEGEIVNIETDGYAGKGILIAADKEESWVANHKEMYRILSMASEYNNPQLWAHYSNGYEGVCLCFSTDKSFKDIRKIQYCMDREDIFVDDENKLDKAIRSGFLKKNSGWGYEGEWRIVRKRNTEYFRFEGNELRGLILGHKLSPEIKDFIVAHVDNGIIIMETDIGHQTFQINVLPLNYSYTLDGTPLKTLNVNETLSKGKYVYKKS